jgi:hypothetical protein
MALVRLRLFSFAVVLCTPVVGGSIEGRVTNGVTGAGIGDALVSVSMRTERGAAGQAVTDDTGVFRIAEVADGQYEIVASKDGFYGAEFAGPQPPVRVSGDTRFDLKMMPSASVRGRVLDPEGKPAAGVAVKLGPGSVSITDENGEFVFKEVPPERTTLSARPKPQPEAKDEMRIVTTFYPSTVDSSQAVPVEVQGVDLFGYDIRLQIAPARGIRGVVLDADGKPAPHAKMSVTQPASRLASGMLTMIAIARGTVISWPQTMVVAEFVEANDDGTFAFPQVLEGDWSIRAALGDLRGVAQVSLSKSNIENLEIRLERPFNMEVTADWGDSPPPATPPDPLMFLPLDSMPGGLSNKASFAGRFLVWPRALVPGFYVAGAMLDNRDVLGQVVELTGPTSLKVVYKTGGGTVRGTVEKGANAMVALMVDATPAARLGYGARCDADGGFVISDLPPGEYTAVVVHDVSDLVGPDFPSFLTANGKRVTVDAGAASQVELRRARP